jgi:hypothetical protein
MMEVPRLVDTKEIPRRYQWISRARVQPSG